MLDHTKQVGGPVGVSGRRTSYSLKPCSLPRRFAGRADSGAAFSSMAARYRTAERQSSGMEICSGEPFPQPLNNRFALLLLESPEGGEARRWWLPGGVDEVSRQA